LFPQEEAVTRRPTIANNANTFFILIWFVS
jgi:hypothetical protein